MACLSCAMPVSCDEQGYCYQCKRDPIYMESEMTQQQEAALFGRVVRAIRAQVVPGSPADKDAEWMAQWVCELVKLGVISNTPAGSLPLPADGE